MSVILVSYCMAAPKPLVRLLKLLDGIRFCILSIFFSGGIHSQPPPPQHAVNTSFIKSQLPLIDFSKYVNTKSPESASGAAGGEERACVFCLEKLEAADRVREVGSCRHAFHGECIDRWIDLGQASCPTCRADLVPKRITRIKERISNSFRNRA